MELKGLGLSAGPAAELTGLGAELDPGFGMEGVKSCPSSFAMGRDHAAGVIWAWHGNLGRMGAAGLALAVSAAQGCAGAHVALGMLNWGNLGTR